MARHNELGRAAEDAACSFLTAHGLVLLERNYRTRGGEVDLVMSHDGVFVFIEVRARSDDQFMHPVETVGPNKRRRLLNAARQYLTERGVFNSALARFDVICFLGHPAMGTAQWIRRAFDA